MRLLSFIRHNILFVILIIDYNVALGQDYAILKIHRTDILEGADLTGNDAEPTVIDYIERMPTDDFVFNSDWLYRIIPIELFINECEYYRNQPLIQSWKFAYEVNVISMV